MVPSTQKPKIYSIHTLTEETITILQENYDVVVSRERVPSKEEILKDVIGAHGILCVRRVNIDKQIIKAAGPSLKVICTFSSGHNHIDVEECKKRNIRIGYLSKIIAGGMAEYTVGLLMSTARRFKQQMSEIQRGRWESFQNVHLLGYELRGSTVGIVGLGNIGQELAKRITAFSVKKILYCGPRRKQEGDVLGLEYTSLNELLQQSDFVIATCSLNENTKKMFNSHTFNLMKPTSIFINVTRGEVVDQEALYEALKSEKIFAAGLDATTPEPLPKGHPLIGLENCVILPHIGTSTQLLRKQMYQTTISNMCAGLKGAVMPDELIL